MTRYERLQGSEPQPDQPHQPRTVLRDDASQRYMMSEIGDGVFVQWGTCSRCSRRVEQCPCAQGPVEPAHIQRWREGRFNREVATRLPRKGQVPANALKAMRSGLFAAWASDGRDVSLNEHEYQAGLAVLERYEAGEPGKVQLVWDCPDEECGREDIPESEFECPRCGAQNPSVEYVTKDAKAETPGECTCTLPPDATSWAINDPACPQHGAQGDTPAEVSSDVRRNVDDGLDKVRSAVEAARGQSDTSEEDRDGDDS